VIEPIGIGARYPVGHPGFTAIVRAQCRSLANSSNWSSFNVKFFIMNFFGK